RKLRDNAEGIVSPDGSRICFVTGLNPVEIGLMGANGEDPHMLGVLNENEGIWQIAWSPDMTRIAELRFHAEADKFEASLESRDLRSGQVVFILSEPKLAPSSLWWLPDGRIIYSQYESPPNQFDSNLWEIRTEAGSGKATGPAKKITDWSGLSV